MPSALTPSKKPSGDSSSISSSSPLSCLIIYCIICFEKASRTLLPFVIIASAIRIKQPSAISSISSSPIPFGDYGFVLLLLLLLLLSSSSSLSSIFSNSSSSYTSSSSSCSYSCSCSSYAGTFFLAFIFWGELDSGLFLC
jgi:hypothetical protein